jgi:hypothetical protein
MKLLIALALFVLLTVTPVVALAVDPTPTPSPTLRPLVPTPTTAFLYFRLTPTPWVFGPPPPSQELHLESVLDAGEVADTAINFWRWVNNGHLLDIIVSGFLGVVTFGLLLRVAERGTKNQG